MEDDFEKNYPGFDWRNTPAWEHPGGKDCPCPKHEYNRERIRVMQNVIRNSEKPTKDDLKTTMKLCPEHYDVFFKEILPILPLKNKIAYRIVTKLKLFEVVKIGFRQSEMCYYCKFGSGGFDKKTELPPM